MLEQVIRWSLIGCVAVAVTIGIRAAAALLHVDLATLIIAVVVIKWMHEAERDAEKLMENPDAE